MNFLGIVFTSWQQRELVGQAILESKYLQILNRRNAANVSKHTRPTFFCAMLYKHLFSYVGAIRGSLHGVVRFLRRGLVLMYMQPFPFARGAPNGQS